MRNHPPSPFSALIVRAANCAGTRWFLTLMKEIVDFEEELATSHG